MAPKVLKGNNRNGEKSKIKTVQIEKGSKSH